MSYAYAKKLLRQRGETGSIASKPHGGGHPVKLMPAQPVCVRVVMIWIRTVFVRANRDVPFHAYRRPLFNIVSNEILCGVHLEGRVGRRM